MSAIKGKFRTPQDNYRNVVHLETETDMVLLNDGSTLTSKLADYKSTALNKGASEIGIHDADSHFSATNVEGALSELFTNVSSGKTAVGTAITGVDPTVVIPTNPTFTQLSSAISQISTGKKWASGVVTPDNTGYRFQTLIGNTTGSIVTLRRISVWGLDFLPSAIIITNVLYPNNERTSYANNKFFCYPNLIKKDSYDAKVVFGAFDAPVDTGLQQYRWYAYE